MLDDTKSRTTFLITTTIKTSLSEEEEEERQSIKKKNLKEIKCIRTAPELSFGLEGRAEPASPTKSKQRRKKTLEVDNGQQDHQVKNTVFWKTN